MNGMDACLCAIVLAALGAAELSEPAGPAAIAQDLLRRFPGSLPATLAAARIELRAGSLDRALSLFAEALRLDPRSFEAREARGDIFARKGRSAEAAEEYRAATALPAGAPESARARLKRAMALLVLGESRVAEAELRESIAKHPGESGLHYQLGQALLARGEGSGAARELEEARRLGDPPRS